MAYWGHILTTMVADGPVAEIIIATSVGKYNALLAIRKCKVQFTIYNFCTGMSSPSSGPCPSPAPGPAPAPGAGWRCPQGGGLAGRPRHLHIQ